MFADVRNAHLLLGLVVAHIGLAGCYQPALRDCTVQCSEPDQCANDQVCLPDGLCAAANVLRCDRGEPVITDASMVAGDTAMADAFDVCTQGCSDGTCIGGVCTIDCSSTGSCQNDIKCPANLPCHVICGDTACGNKIDCTMAASCTVDCVGANACDDEVQCPSNRTCDVTCSGAGACKKRVKCSSSCACNITCSGLGSCIEASECPDSDCRVGNGCTSHDDDDKCDTC